MSSEITNGKVVPTQTFNLSEILDTPAIAKGERVGRLDEFVVVDRDNYAEVTHLCIRRPFGRPTLVVPWEKVASFGKDQVVLDIESIESFAGAFPPTAILLKDYILDKKVLDQRGGELEVVYDIGMTLTGNKLLVVDVDLSKAALLRRMRLAWLWRLLAKPSSQGNGDRIPWRYVAALPEDLGSFKGALKLKVLKEQLSELPPVDLADILEELAPEQRMAIFGALDTARASDALEALDPKVQRDVVASLDKEIVARLMNEMSPAQAADLLAVLPWWDVKALMQLLGNPERKAKLTAILEKQEEEAVHFSTSRFLRFAPEQKVAQVRAMFPEAAKGKVETSYVYVVDEGNKLLGVMDSKALLLAEESARLDEIMTTKVIALGPQRTLRDAYELFSRYLFRALPITDDNAKILGVLRYRDVVALRHRYIE